MVSILDSESSDPSSILGKTKVFATSPRSDGAGPAAADGAAPPREEVRADIPGAFQQDVADSVQRRAAACDASPDGKQGESGRTQGSVRQLAGALHSK